MIPSSQFSHSVISRSICYSGSIRPVERRSGVRDISALKKQGDFSHRDSNAREEPRYAYINEAFLSFFFESFPLPSLLSRLKRLSKISLKSMSLFRVWRQERSLYSRGLLCSSARVCCHGLTEGDCSVARKLNPPILSRSFL